MEAEYKIISVKLYDPLKEASISYRYTNKATCEVIKCNASERCELFKRGECLFKGTSIHRCPHGTLIKEEGYTAKAQKYSQWVRDRRNKYEGFFMYLKPHTKTLSIIGDYLYMPYERITWNDTVPFIQLGNSYNRERQFIKLQDFNVDSLTKICQFIPRDHRGIEITNYKDNQVSKIVKHVSEKFPDLFDQLCVTYYRVFDIMGSWVNIGRKAFLETLNSNTGEFVDVHKAIWKWDGEWLISGNSRASFMLISDFDEIRIKPKKNTIVTISSEDQVNENTIFTE